MFPFPLPAAYQVPRLHLYTHLTRLNRTQTTHISPVGQLSPLASFRSPLFVPICFDKPRCTQTLQQEESDTLPLPSPPRLSESFLRSISQHHGKRTCQTETPKIRYARTSCRQAQALSCAVLLVRTLPLLRPGPVSGPSPSFHVTHPDRKISRDWLTDSSSTQTYLPYSPKSISEAIQVPHNSPD